ncbi:hypothetical protein PBY51_007170 [Eleginops maclovinus]|uniref:Uncharacterized protein n=1 Tax=Eleginops maclovinus TaxID=56733 RepID=A0AAN7WWI9_ELEMC|nr:hypothetical protein PBY51_007170 [Eleginops maclovinus]
MEMSEPVSTSGDEDTALRGGGGTFVMQREGAGEVTLQTIRGQLLRSSIFRLDSVLSAGVLMLLNRQASIVALGRSAAMCK